MGYLVPGAGGNADANHVLAGDGTWVLGLPPTEGLTNKTLKIDSSGKLVWD